MGIFSEILFRDFMCFGVVSLADNSLQIIMDKFLPGNRGED